MEELTVVFMYPNLIVNSKISKVVSSIEEGIELAKSISISEKFYGFYFCRQEYMIANGKRYNGDKWVTGNCYVIGEVLTYKDILNMNSNDDYWFLLLSMCKNNLKKIVRTRCGNWHPMHEGLVVWNENFEEVAA